MCKYSKILKNDKIKANALKDKKVKLDRYRDLKNYEVLKHET